jgi:hypothetical protein
MLRGDDLGLASGAMFAGDKENARVAREKKKQFVDLLDGTLQAKGLDYEYEYHRQYSVHVVTFKHEGNEVRRSFFDGDIIARSPRAFLVQQLFGVFSELNVPFDKEDVRLVDEIIPEIKVHDGTPPPVPEVYGGPPAPSDDPGGAAPDSAYDDYADPVPVPETVEDNLGQVAEVGEVVPIALATMTIKQLRDYGKDNERIVPASITRKDDIIEYLTDEHSDGSG